MHNVSKNIPDIFNCNLTTNYQILVIFGTNIPDTTCHQKPFSFSFHSVHNINIYSVYNYHHTQITAEKQIY